MRVGLEPQLQGDPPLFALAAPGTFDGLESYGTDEYRVVEGPMTLTDVRGAETSFT